MNGKQYERWYSHRMYRDIGVARWGHWGRPVLLFPTAGGDAEECERQGLIDSVGHLIEAGAIKVYSCDSVAGDAMVRGEGSPRFRAALLNAFHDAVANEVVPLIRADMRSPDVSVVATGASIGAFNAVAAVCRYPQLFTQAIGMSGTYDIARFIGGDAGDDLYFAAPLYFLPGLDGPQLQWLQQRFVILATGQGRWENAGESWNMAHTLGQKGVPNRVDPWGTEYDHDWPTWRRMLPHYLGQLG